MHDHWAQATGHLRSGNLDEAETSLRRALQQAPSNTQLLNTLAYVCHAQGRIGESIGLLRKACRLEPADTGTRYSLAVLLEKTGRQQEALAHYLENLCLDPSHGLSHVALSVIYIRQLDFTSALEHLEQALAIDSSDALAQYNLGLVKMRTGQSVEADECFTRALLSSPGLAAAQTCRLLNLHNLSGVADRAIFQAHMQWAEQYAGLAAGPGPGRNSTAQYNRPVRVGYVSADFRRHSIANFCLPVFRAHDRRNVECFCYSNAVHTDGVTEKIRGAADNWRDISALDDEQVAELVRQDSIDILVDLSGHTDGNRLPVFARKPAPVQVTWLGYPDTTGLAAIDFRITDERADPAGVTDRYHAEKLVRLEPCFLCYEPVDQAHTAAIPPVQANGFITFGSFNNLAKVSDETISAWSEILLRVAGARLLLKAKGLGDPTARAILHGKFAAHGVTQDRIECIGHIQDTRAHLELYNRVDIALDTFPYNGTTTTCEALWMSVPVITRIGSRHASRVGLCLLHAAGLPELAAASTGEYTALATEWAADPARLGDLRSGLRERVLGSGLMDTAGFTKNLEQVYRQILQTVTVP
jgi:protein O-GlcNAc transferase